MKQGKTYIKIIMIVLAAMVVSYIVYNMVRAASSGVPTTQAVLYSASEGVTTEGFLVRREQVLPADYDLVLPMAGEGEKVAKGAQVALSLRSTQAQDRQNRIQNVRENISRLELALSFQAQLEDNVAVAAKIDETAGLFAAQVSQGRLDNAQVLGESLKSLVLRQELGTDDTEAMENQLAQLRTELENLETGAAGETTAVVADHAGYYSAVADGYEEILTPERVSSMSVEDFRILWEAQERPDRPGCTAGRLIDSVEWYYAALVDVRHLESITAGEQLLVSLGGDLDEELEMTVERVERTGGEQGLLVLGCDRRLSDISALRRLKATVVFRSYSGVRVPKEAVCYSEENESAGVYILENGKALWKDVTLLFDVGDAYIAKLDQSTTRNLWPGDLILTQTAGLYDGKVVS